ETAELTAAYLELGDDEDLNTVTLRQSVAVLDAGRGEFESALAHVRAARRLAGDEFIAVQYPPVLAAAEAEVAAWRGRLEEAAAAWEESGHPYPLAVARWRAAEALLARRMDRTRATELLGRSHATASSLGAEPLRGELERLARLGRVDLRPRRPAGEPAAPAP